MVYETFLFKLVSSRILEGMVEINAAGYFHPVAWSSVGSSLNEMLNETN